MYVSKTPSVNSYEINYSNFWLIQNKECRVIAFKVEELNENFGLCKNCFEKNCLGILFVEKIRNEFIFYDHDCLKKLNFECFNAFDKIFRTLKDSKTPKSQYSYKYNRVTQKKSLKFFNEEIQRFSREILKKLLNEDGFSRYNKIIKDKSHKIKYRRRFTFSEKDKSLKNKYYRRFTFSEDDRDFILSVQKIVFEILTLRSECRIDKDKFRLSENYSTSLALGKVHDFSIEELCDLLINNNIANEDVAINNWLNLINNNVNEELFDFLINNNIIEEDEDEDEDEEFISQVISSGFCKQDIKDNSLDDFSLLPSNLDSGETENKSSDIQNTNTFVLPSNGDVIQMYQIPLEQSSYRIEEGHSNRRAAVEIIEISDEENEEPRQVGKRDNTLVRIPHGSSLVPSEGEPFHGENWKVIAFKVVYLNKRFPPCHDCNNEDNEGFLFGNHKGEKRFYDLKCAEHLYKFAFKTHQNIHDSFSRFTNVFKWNQGSKLLPVVTERFVLKNYPNLFSQSEMTRINEGRNPDNKIFFLELHKKIYEVLTLASNCSELTSI